MMQKLLIIGYVWPEPNSSAAGTRMMTLIKLFLERGWQLRFASPAQRGGHEVDLAALGVASDEIALNNISFDHYVADYSPDMVLFDRFMMEEQFGWRVEQCCPSALRVLDTEDLHFLRDARHRALKRGRSVEAGDYCSDMAKREVAAIFRSDLTLMISSVECELLTSQFSVPPSLLLYSPFMLPPPRPLEALPAFEQRRHFISIGNFRHAPNWDAVLQLKQKVWPLIRRQLPEAELHIYGAYPPKKATELHQPKQGFLVKGWAEDAQQVVSDSRVLLAPLRFGAGQKGKLVEAMQCGTPSVTTSVGAEAMASLEGWPGAVCDDWQDFADAAVALYRGEGWQQSRLRGRALLSDRYDAQQLGDALMAKVTELAASIEQHRQSNFIGLMLRHHHHKSTQYMAQWIEAKNRQS
ncbi:glycosyltransferase [Sinobacterium caligoides]|nr:glycosyltransferase [Sinobacterium caligoides]